MVPGNFDRNVYDLCYAFKYHYSITEENFVIIPQVYGRFAKDEFYPFLWNYYGGEVYGRHFDEQLPFVGSDPLSLTGPVVTVLRCDLRYNLFGKHYLTGIYNIALDYSNLYYSESGMGLKYSYNSFIGPVSLTMQWNELRKKASGYLSIGYYF